MPTDVTLTISAPCPDDAEASAALAYFSVFQVTAPGVIQSLTRDGNTVNCTALLTAWDPVAAMRPPDPPVDPPVDPPAS